MDGVNINVRLIVKDDWRAMAAVTSSLLTQLDEATEATAEAIVADIRSSWSGSSPSSRGAAPAVVSGVLDNSVLVDPQGRDDSGRFTSKENTRVRFIRVDTSERDPGGDNYAVALEDPNYLDRPFLQPAMERAGVIYTSAIKKFLRL